MKFLKLLYDKLIYPLFILLGILGAIGAALFSLPLSLYMKLKRQPSQHELFEESFHRVISLVEMHKVRFGDYPENLLDSGVLQYLVGEDLKVMQSVIYQKVEMGYELNLGAEEVVRINLPRGFWQGLGLVKTNVAGFPEQN